jgi:hypothetical protein
MPGFTLDPAGELGRPDSGLLSCASYADSTSRDRTKTAISGAAIPLSGAVPKKAATASASSTSFFAINICGGGPLKIETVPPPVLQPRRRHGRSSEGVGRRLNLPLLTFAPVAD